MSSHSRSSKMKTSTLLLSALTFGVVRATVPSEACSSDGPPAHIPWDPEPGETRTFSIGGRDVNIYIPQNYTQKTEENPAPMIFAFHDRDMYKEQMIEVTKLHDPNVNRDKIIVMPVAGKTMDSNWRSDIRPLRASQARPEPGGIDDIDFTVALIEDLQRVVCIDLTRIHAFGFGTGGGMMDLLACHETASTRIASFASVGGGYGRDDNKTANGTWANCTPGRKPIPMMSVHGAEDRVQPYFLLNWEDSKKRLSVPAWLDKWSELNGCGEETLDDVQSETEKRTTYTRLEGGGVMTKGDQYGTGLVRMGKACPVTEDSEGKKIKTPKELRLGDPTDSELSILHYKLPGVSHIWPRLQFPRLPELETEEEAAESSQGKMEIKLNEKGEPVLQTVMAPNTQKLLFDTTVLMLDWFKSHPLPPYWATKHKQADAEHNTQREEMQKAMKKNNEMRGKENEKLLEHIETRVREGKMTEEQAEVYRARIRGPGKKGGEEDEVAGYGVEEEDDGMEVVLDEEDVEKKLRDLDGKREEGVAVDDYEEEDDDDEVEAKGHDEL